MKRRNILQEIFSLQNSKKHKVVTILGIKIKIKSKKLIKRIKIKKINSDFEEILSATENKKLILFFDHNLGGGTEKYFFNQIHDIDDNHLIIRVQYFLANKTYTISTFVNSKEINIKNLNLEFLLKKLDLLNIEKIAVNNIVSYPKVKKILEYISSKNIYTILKIHDFYSICPNWTLLDENNDFCNVCDDDKICKKCEKKFKLRCEDIKENFTIQKWRNLWGNFIYKNVDEVEIFSPYSSNIFLKAYPFAKDKIKLLPHKIRPFPKYNIAILGNLSIHKGAKIIKNLVRYLYLKGINEFHFILIGQNPKNIQSELLTVIGSYKRDNLLNILDANKINAIMIPSICPETFSYTTAEAIASGYPVLCFNLGGQADQVIKYSKGKILSSFEPEIITSELKQFLEEQKEKNNETFEKILNSR